MSGYLPYDKKQRKLLGDFFRGCNGDPAQEYLDEFRMQNPEFEYSSLALLITKRRQLLSLGVLDPVSDEDRKHIEEYRDQKKRNRIRLSHPAEKHYRNRSAARRIMRSQIHY